MLGGGPGGDGEGDAAGAQHAWLGTGEEHLDLGGLRGGAQGDADFGGALVVGDGIERDASGADVQDDGDGGVADGQLDTDGAVDGADAPGGDGVGAWGTAVDASGGAGADASVQEQGCGEQDGATRHDVDGVQDGEGAG